MTYTSKNDLIGELNKQLGSVDRQAIKGLMTVFANQTSSEQQSGDVHCDNGIGFTGADAPILTSFANQYKKYGRLSPKQLALLKKKMPKYAKQLIEGSIAKGLIIKEGGKYVFTKKQ